LLLAVFRPYFLNRVRVVKNLFKHFFRGILLAFLLTAVHSVFGQQLEQAPWNDPDIVWLLPAEAQIAVQTKLDQLEPQLAGLVSGTVQHTDMLRQIIFYKSILRSLVNGLPIAQAIESSVLEAATLGGAHERTFTAETVLRDLHDEALALLSN